MVVKTLLTPAQAAQILAISTKQIHALTVAGELPFIDIGRGTRPTRRYHPDDIEDFISRRRIISQPSIRQARRSQSSRHELYPTITEILAARIKEKEAAKAARAAGRK